MRSWRSIFAAVLLLSGSKRAACGQELLIPLGGDLLGAQVAEILKDARPGNRAETISSLQAVAADASRGGQISAWAWALTGSAEQLLLLEEEGTEWSDLEPVKVLEEVIEKCEKLNLTNPLARALAAHGRCLAELDQPFAAARDWQRAGSLALDSGQIERAIELFANAARVYRNENQAAKVRESVTWLQTILKERAAEVGSQGRKTIESYIHSVKDLLALTPDADFQKPASVSLQPLVSGVLVSSAEHEDGRCRYVLHNPTTHSVEGVLTITASQGNVSSWKDRLIVLVPSNKPAPAQKKLRLLPGEIRRIYLGHHGYEKNVALEDVISLSWSDNSTNINATATFRFSSLPAPRTQVVNASQIAAAMGRPVPLYHEIYSREKSLTTENFLATVSQPARLEFYNEETGELVAVDAEGDGDYNGPGDVLEIANDRDGDRRPDLVLGPQAVASLEVYVFPKRSAAGTTQLFLNLADYSTSPATWRNDAPDTVETLAE